MMHRIIPGNKNSVVFGMKYPTKAMTAVAAMIFTTGITGALVLVNLNAKYMHGIIMKRQANVVAAAPPAIPKIGTITQQRIAVTIDPKIRMYIGILGFPIP